ncbi:MAG: hypothetical protein IJA43_08835 [Clostridia bacterium]|nr:hypothetical protein [Clostridia bacterium]
MLEGIFGFFEWLSTLFQIVIDFIVNLIENLIAFFQLIPSVLVFVGSAISYLPSSIMIFATVGITVSVMYLILGRDDGQ